VIIYNNEHILKKQAFGFLSKSNNAIKLFFITVRETKIRNIDKIHRQNEQSFTNVLSKEVN
jgi:integrase/recombinase XerD